MTGEVRVLLMLTKKKIWDEKDSDQIYSGANFLA